MGRNKKSVTLDLRTEKGKEMFLKMVEKTDVIIENFRTGTLDKWGIGYDKMKEANKDIILSHDIGKIGIDEEILNKKGKLNEKEWEIIKTHTAKSARILEHTVEYKDLAKIVLSHHAGGHRRRKNTFTNS